MQRLTHYLLAHRWIALLLTFLVTFVPLVGTAGIIFAAFITLYRGVFEGAMYAVAATLPYAIGFVISGHPEHVAPFAIWIQFGMAVLSNLVTWVLAVMLFRQTTWSNMLQLAALGGVLVISIIHVVYPNVADWWGTLLQASYDQAAAVASGVLKTPAAVPKDTSIEAINLTKQYTTGFIAAAILLFGVLQLIMARWWFALTFKPGLLRRELHQIRLSRLAGVLFAMSLAFAYLGNRVVLDIMPVLYLLFAAAGLSLVHCLFGMMYSKTTLFWMVLLYFTLIFTAPMSLVVLAFLAFFDIWLNLRKRFSKHKLF